VRHALVLLVGALGACDLDSRLPGNVDAPQPDADVPVDAGDDSAVDAFDAASVTCGALAAKSSTRGLWCFREGAGTTTANLAGCAGDITGIAPADWRSGGVEPVTSLMRIPDSTCLDLGTPWEVQVEVELGTLPSRNQAVLWRADHTVGSAVPQWVRLGVSVTGQLSCEVGRNNIDAFNVQSGAGTIAPGAHVLACKRNASGVLTVWLDGVDVTSTTNGTPHGATTATDQDFTVGYTDAPSSIQPDTPLRVIGVIKGVAIHAE